jgi:hypothetical protein
LAGGCFNVFSLKIENRSPFLENKKRIRDNPR